jgi:hypothetical protein
LNKIQQNNTLKKSKNDTHETWLAILMGVLAIFLVKSIFENDNSKIISKKGSRILSDEDKMNEINSKINTSEGANSHQEVLI